MSCHGLRPPKPPDVRISCSASGRRAGSGAKASTMRPSRTSTAVQRCSRFGLWPRFPCHTPISSCSTSSTVTLSSSPLPPPPPVVAVAAAPAGPPAQQVQLHELAEDEPERGLIARPRHGCCCCRWVAGSPVAQRRWVEDAVQGWVHCAAGGGGGGGGCVEQHDERTRRERTGHVPQTRAQQGQVAVSDRPVPLGEEPGKQGRHVRDEDETGRFTGAAAAAAAVVGVVEDLPQPVHVKDARDHDALETRPRAGCCCCCAAVGISGGGGVLIPQLGVDGVPERRHDGAGRLGRDEERLAAAAEQELLSENLEAELDGTDHRLVSMGVVWSERGVSRAGRGGDGMGNTDWALSRQHSENNVSRRSNILF
ncbi:hypothetical protein AAL_07560 [Moelleriella libera RCEF 2490]|uniref:Uncharacterized protein n=1 Tax=Moelleriella libera RCEF 2490 TaxID=1081109 RepID=A0A167X5V6_9HYPO|nr:hypothetical protein AAL_07560 [Moelleriella libera RCEF 2490]